MINQKYLVVGNGKLAKQFLHYFKLLNIEFGQWTRNSTTPLESLLPGYSRILLLIKDDAIVPFLDKHFNKVDEIIWVHCSGVISIPLAESAHPLGSFSDFLYDLDFYKSIPFATEKNRKSFKEIFPELSNPFFEIDKNQKVMYHTIATVAGNFTTLLWMEFQKYLESELGVNKEYSYPFLNTIHQNLIKSKKPLTGPFVRNDVSTINNQLKVLSGKPLEDIYKSFLTFYMKDRLR